MSPDPNHGSRGSAASPPATNNDMNDNFYPGGNTIDTLDADADDFIVKVEDVHESEQDENLDDERTIVQREYVRCLCFHRLADSHPVTGQ